jgi:transmembrane sensor
MIQEVPSLDRLRSMPPDEAAALLTVRGGGAPRAQDQETLGAWLRLGEANVQAWARAQKAWSSFEAAEDDEILNAMRRAALKARPAMAVKWRPLAAAAALLVVLTGALWGRLGVGVPDRGSKTAIAPAGARQAAARPAADYVTPRGRPGVFSLADGSRLTLDTDSAVATAFTSTRRDLRLLRGRAFFEVKHDARRPFAVHADGREVVALGTRFDVRMDPGRVRVVLVEGTVSVQSLSPAAPPTVLHAGEQLVDRAGASPVVSPARIEEALNWQRGFVTFDDDTLAAAAAELNRYSRDQIVVRDPHVARLRVTGMFQAGDPMRFGRILAQVHPVRMVRTGAGQLEILPAG